MNSPRSQLQTDIESVSANGTLELGPQEYPGPITIQHSLTIDGRGATIWALKGPVLTVLPGVKVRLKNLRVEVTGEEPVKTHDEEVAIKVSPSANVDLDEVEVRGAIDGMAQEGGQWRYPKSLYLGTFSASQPNEFQVRLVAGAGCKITSQVSGLEVSPASVGPGPTTLLLKVDKLRDDTYLHGRILIKTAFSKRWIVISGHGTNAVSASQTPHGILWEPSDWNTITAAPVAAPVPHAVSVPQLPTPNTATHVCSVPIAIPVSPNTPVDPVVVGIPTKVTQTSSRPTNTQGQPGKSHRSKPKSKSTTNNTNTTASNASPSIPPPAVPTTVATQKGRRVHQDPTKLGVFGNPSVASLPTGKAQQVDKPTPPAVGNQPTSVTEVPPTSTSSLMPFPIAQSLPMQRNQSLKSQEVKIGEAFGASLRANSNFGAKKSPPLPPSPAPQPAIPPTLPVPPLQPGGPESSHKTNSPSIPFKLPPNSPFNKKKGT